jgi:clan AA aspartic protease
MGEVYAEITLRNAADVTNADSGLIDDREIRETAVRALVDTGATTIVITEEIREKLGLKVRGLKQVTLANDSKDTAKVTEPVEIKWKDRETSCRALVINGWGDALLGLIPLEDMDLVVDPVRHELAGAHGDEIVTYVRKFKDF